MKYCGLRNHLAILFLIPFLIYKPACLAESYDSNKQLDTVEGGFEEPQPFVLRQINADYSFPWDKGDNTGGGGGSSGIDLSGQENENRLSSAPGDLTRATGNFVDQRSGSFNYTFPINIPRGVAGHTPSMSLQYNSNYSKFGLLGAGWGISGWSCITRSAPALVGSDGVARFPRGIPSYSSSDTFRLDGKRLVSCDGSISCPDSSYRTVQDNFARIKINGQNWEVTQKNGTKSIYIPVEPENNSNFNNVYRWCLESIQDTSGNLINFEATNTNGLAYLHRVYWGGVLGGPPKWGLDFNWALRPDVKEFYKKRRIVN